METKLKLNNVRLSFPNVFKKAVYEGKDTKYEATFLLHKEKQKDLIAKIKKTMEAFANEEYSGDVPRSLKYALSDGDEKDYDGYPGHMVLKAKSNHRPTVVGRDRAPIVEEDGVLYSGCYVNAIVDFWSQNNTYGKRINCNLLGVQFHADGERFGAGQEDVTGDFDELADDSI